MREHMKMNVMNDIQNEESKSGIADSSSSSPDSMSTSTHNDGSMSAETDEAENGYFAKSENRRVNRLKILVFLVFFLVSIAVCLAIFFVISRSQQEEFEIAFEGVARKILQISKQVFSERMEVITALGVTLTSYATDTNQTWPFVTLPDFQDRLASTRKLSGTLGIQILPKVTRENAAAWGAYSMNNQGWLGEGRQHLRDLDIPDELNPDIEIQVPPFIYNLGAGYGNLVPDTTSEVMFPLWQQSPVLPITLVNYNVFRSEALAFDEYINITQSTGQVSIGNLLTAKPGGIDPETGALVFEGKASDLFVTYNAAGFLSYKNKEATEYSGEPMGTIFVPVMDDLSDDPSVAAILIAHYQWGDFFRDILVEDEDPIQVVIENDCDGAFTYTVDGASVYYNGKGNMVEDNDRNDIAIFETINTDQIVLEDESLKLKIAQICPLTIRVYPTKQFEDSYNDHFPMITTLVIASVFFFTAGLFIFYDLMIERRQRKVLDTAKRSTAIVSSIFPKKVRDQLMSAPVQGNATKLRSIASNPLSATGNLQTGDGSEPIADLFPDCTVMFADVEGFTAWSSVREPSQVFMLLETLYGAFDRIALRRKVFKVETVGDCYVAVCGLPEPCKDSAVKMGRFAQECIESHIKNVKALEVQLGPGTGDLCLRVGLNSGPITAGVLRGERSRFQLFGDTVNTCSRIETSGAGNRIHVSERTAGWIREAGHQAWLTKRDAAINVKGKGKMNTYWLQPRSKGGSVASDDDTTMPSTSIGSEKGIVQNTDRLVAWNADLLIKMIKKIVAGRRESTRHSRSSATGSSSVSSVAHDGAWTPSQAIPLEEVKEIIELPQHNDGATVQVHQDSDNIKLDPVVEELVYDYVGSLAMLYRSNPFHNFEHASHVTMSVGKLLSRIVAPSDMDFADGKDATKKLHDHTYGITSDPLTQFACLLAALIHDVDHQGVTNTTLTIENDPLVTHYSGKSMAEQNSVDISWDLLMSEKFRPLVSVLCQDEKDLIRLRQLIVNTVMATDIMDPDLKNLRNNRWDKAFHACNDEGTRTAINRKATIVIEHLIQASDVSHTMQHWNVYTKWNARLFKEMYRAYLDGRGGAKNPAEFWAKGEIGFFDFYIIPLAKKLKECGVFGVSSDEFLNYAQANRDEWEQKGESIVETLMAEVNDDVRDNIEQQGE